jgi:hypothetical protein
MRRLALVVLSLLFIACLEESASYSPEADDQAMASLTRTWTRPDEGASLSLCEDLEAAAVPLDANDCQIENVTRGGGRGTRHDESRGGGCGGCPFANVAYVKGTVSGVGLAVPVQVHGTVDLGNYDDPYDFPYRLALVCDDTTAPCYLTGELEADGSLDLVNEAGGEAVLAPTGAATCSP